MLYIKGIGVMLKNMHMQNLQLEPILLSFKKTQQKLSRNNKKIIKHESALSDKRNFNSYKFNNQI